jgi:Tfp pilus assembly protein PilO
LFFFAISEQQEKLKQAEQAEKEKLKKFKQQVQSKLDALLASDTQIKVKFEPMENFFRNVV